MGWSTEGTVSHMARGASHTVASPFIGRGKLGARRGARTHACSVHNRVNALRVSREIITWRRTTTSSRVTASGVTGYRYGAETGPAPRGVRRPQRDGCRSHPPDPGKKGNWL